MMKIKLQQLTLENIGSWPPAIKIISLIFIFMLILVLSYWFDTASQLKQFRSLMSQQPKTNQTINIKHRQQQLLQLNESFIRLLYTLSTTQEIPETLQAIADIGIAAGLHPILFKPEPEIQATLYIKLPLEIAMSGNYQQIKQFIANVTALNRMVILQNFEIKSLTSAEPRQLPAAQKLPKQLMLTAAITIYIAKQKLKSMPPVSAIPSLPIRIWKTSHAGIDQVKSARNLFQQFTNATIKISVDSGKKSPLETYTLSSLIMTGTIKKNEKIWALVVAADGIIYPVRVGQFIGEHHGKIIKITADNITVAERVRINQQWKRQQIQLFLKK